MMVKPPPPWKVCRVEVHPEIRRGDAWLEHGSGALFACPACAGALPVYDHTRERSWRHLDTCDYETWLHAALPRVSCAEHGTVQVKPPLADGRSSLTCAMERRAAALTRSPSAAARAPLR
jgi:transposase